MVKQVYGLFEFRLNSKSTSASRTAETRELVKLRYIRELKKPMGLVRLELRIRIPTIDYQQIVIIDKVQTTRF